MLTILDFHLNSVLYITGEVYARTTYIDTCYRIYPVCLITNTRVYSLYLFVFVLILSLPREGWYLDKRNRTSIPYLGF